jgi:hypothetical protein
MNRVVRSVSAGHPNRGPVEPLIGLADGVGVTFATDVFRFPAEVLVLQRFASGGLSDEWLSVSAKTAQFVLKITFEYFELSSPA